MIPIVTAHEMRECDRIAIDKLGIPGIVLMENAGRGVVEAIGNKYGDLKDKTFLILCGKGNNGGDGFVVARHLYNKGARVKVILLCKATELKGDAKTNLQAYLSVVSSVKNKNFVDFAEYKGIFQLKKKRYIDFIIDGIFGTGFSGSVNSQISEVIDWINRTGTKTISIDIPSGINADNGIVENTAVKADLVVTMGLKKMGLLVGKSVDYIKDIEVVDIGIPRFITHHDHVVVQEVESFEYHAMSTPPKENCPQV